ncbi:MAG: ATP synthase subunit I [Thermodesulfobacteriota bacterium]
MSEPFGPVSALAAGMLLGAFFFGGLWWTVRRGVSSARPALWFFGSLLVRTGVTLAGFFAVSEGRWEKLMACLIGFILARLIVTRLTRSAGKPARPAQEAGHATEP